MTYQPIPIKEEGNQKRAIVSDWDNQNLLEQILTTLKKIEFHLSIASDTNLNNENMEE